MKTSRALLLILGAVSLAATTPNALAAPGSCTVAEAARLPVYANQGTWSPDGSRLYLVDPVNDQIHVYEAGQGHYKGLLPAPAAVGEEAFFPLSVRTFQGNLVIETFPQQLLFLGRQAQVMEVRQPLRDLRRASSGSTTSFKDGKATESLESLFLWTFAGEDVVGCGDIKNSAGEWKSAIVRFALNQPTKLETYAVSDFSDPQWVFCRLGFPYIASIGDTAYVLLFNHEPGIYASKRGSREFRRLQYYDLPGGPIELPEFTDPRQFAKTMEAVERETLPVGLYASKGSLYVLHRRPERAGGTRWMLQELDPATGKALGEARIASTASHLMLIPGETWALVEKGRVGQLGDQETHRIRFLSSAKLESLRGELCGN